MEPKSEGEDRPWQSYHTAYTNAKAGSFSLYPSIYKFFKGLSMFSEHLTKWTCYTLIILILFDELNWLGIQKFFVLHFDLNPL